MQVCAGSGPAWLAGDLLLCSGTSLILLLLLLLQSVVGYLCQPPGTEEPLYLPPAAAHAKAKVITWGWAPDVTAEGPQRRRQPLGSGRRDEHRPSSRGSSQVLCLGQPWLAVVLVLLHGHPEMRWDYLKVGLAA